MAPIDLTTTGTAVGGAAVARDDGDRVVFVDGALAGERVAVEVTEARRRFARGRVVDVIEPSPHRVTPTCVEVARRCGGCDLAHASPAGQFAAKREMVVDSLRRIGKLAEVPEPAAGPTLVDRGFRTSVRAAVSGGRAGLRRRASHESVAVGSCEVAHPDVEELLVEGRYDDADEVSIRVGARTGDRMVVVSPRVGPGVVVPDGVTVVGADEVAAGRRAAIVEEVAGVRFRVSAGSFFQSRPDGADALVDVVGSLLPSSAEVVADLCCGVGLFGATVGPALGARRVVGVESSRSAVADARHNLAGVGQPAKVIATRLERWTPSRADVVIADPARAGLGRDGVRRVVATGAPVVVLVSCDPASLGRDAGLLAAEGYELDAVTLVDMFPQTSHVESVSRFRRKGSTP